MSFHDNFPPLPTRPLDAHSRISSLQSYQTGRSSTPKVPPGFENVARVEDEASNTTKSNVTAPVLPIVPINTVKQPVTPKSKKESNRDNTVSTSPASLSKTEEQTKSPVKSVETPKSLPSPEQTLPSIQNTISDDSGTPSTTVASPAPDVSRRPRTIRLTTSMIKQNESLVPTSPVIEKTKQEHSRQPSTSSPSQSRPSTPTVSDHFLSRDVSRANSPPPTGIVGSAPARNKSKNQTKKDRKEKAKKTEHVDGLVSTDVTPATPVEDVAPIVARQKKQKKKTGAPADVSKPPKTKVGRDVESKVILPGDETPRSPVKTDTPAAVETPNRKPVQRSSFTVRELCNEAAQAGDDPGNVKKLLSEHIPSMTRIINDMIASGDLTRDHPWLTIPSFSSPAYKLPPDSRKGQDYLDGNGYGGNDAFGYVYLPQKEKRALYAGHAVSVADTGDRKNDLLRRCLISPNGWVMRHLSADESERVLELEERRSLYIEEFGELGQMNSLGVLEDDDFINLGGGIEELGRHGGRHGVCWVMGNESQTDEDAYDELDEDEDDMLAQDGMSEETDEDLNLNLTGSNGNAAWDPTFTTSASGNLGSNTLLLVQSSADTAINLRAMDTDALHARIKEKHKEFDVSRKEAEKAEKALARKNKEVSRWKDTILKA